MEAGFIHYGNIPPTAVISGTMTVTHGITPNVATIYCAPFASPVSNFGNLVITCGNRTVTFPDCRLADVSYEIGTDGRQIQVIRVMDRRWKWAYGWIRGSYNVRHAENIVVPEREKTPQELAELCFKAMGEPKFDAQALPKDVRPTVDWDMPPAQALAQLAETLGCRVMVNPATNLATIAKAGHGFDLPLTATVVSDNLTLDPPDLPESVTFLGGYTLYQCDLELEAVAKEPIPFDKIVPLDKASYKPTDGWEYECPTFFSGIVAQQGVLAGFEEKNREKLIELAKECVWRYYQVKVPFKTPWGETIQERERILPLVEHQAQRRYRYKDYPREEVVKEYMPCELFGEFYSGDMAGRETPKWAATPLGPKAVWQRGFTIDAERGLVIVSEPCYRRLKLSQQPLPNGSYNSIDVGLFPAKLWLRCAINIRDADTWAYERKEYEYKPGGGKKTIPALYVARSDIRMEHFELTNAAGTTKKDNQKRFESEAKHYIEQALTELQLSTPGTRRYAGMVQVPLDGAIQQITWEIDGQGYFYTTVSRNREEIHTDISYKEKRDQEKLKTILTQRDQDKLKEKKR